MCLAFPGKVKKIENKKVTVQYPNETRTAMLGDRGVKVGDYVMVQMGIVTKVISHKEYKNSTRAWQRV